MKAKDIDRITQISVIKLLEDDIFKIMENFYAITKDENLCKKNVSNEYLEKIINESIDRIKYLFNIY